MNVVLVVSFATDIVIQYFRFLNWFGSQVLPVLKRYEVTTNCIHATGLLPSSKGIGSPNIPEEKHHNADAQQQSVDHLEGADDGLKQELHLLHIIRWKGQHQSRGRGG